MLANVQPDKITARHRQHLAYVYVRQSTLKQVQHNRESQKNQLALVERAVALGWQPERVRVIDVDLAQSGQDGTRRGFQELVAEVSLGHVGIIFTYEVSRLARSNADWYALLDLAALVGALIADADGVYEPRAYNDRLLLGLRGMLSEAELHLLHLRLDAGRMRQVEQGRYQQRLPTGLVRLPDGRVIKDPDLQVQRTIELVFARFAELGVCKKVLLSFRDDGLLVPRLQRSGPLAGQMVWKKPSDSALYDILHNPAYAGVFVYGRHAPHPSRRLGQRARVIHRPMEDWTAVHHDAYPAYIRWEEFMANQARLSDNASSYDLKLRGVPRQGNALLTGLVFCGRCGRQMRVCYKPRRHYYVCSALNWTFGDPSCLYLPAAGIEGAVVEAFFQAIKPAELDLLEEVLAAKRADRARLEQQYTDQVTRAEYEARLAQRQYQAVDPDNRLVAGELERRWELALRALAEAREAADRFAQSPPEPALDPALRHQLSQLSIELPALWASGKLSPAQKKQLLRSLIRRIVLTRPVRETIEVKVVWVSGAISILTVHPPIHRLADLGNYDQMVERIVVLAAEGYQDGEIARRLNAEGYRAPRGATIPTVLVRRVRVNHGQGSLTEQFRSQEKIDGRWTILGLARLLGVNRNKLYTRIKSGILPVSRHPVTGHYLVADDPDLIARLRDRLAPKALA